MVRVSPSPSPDLGFQSREYFKLTEAHLAGQGQSLQAIGLAMRWQVEM